MQHHSLFVLDIETIPYVEAVLNLSGFDNPDVAVLREVLDRYHLEFTTGKMRFRASL